MEEIVLILFVLGLMVLFFLLGAAIGGVARSLKAYFFGVKDHEKVWVNNNAQPRDQGFDTAAAALTASGMASGAVLSQRQEQAETTVQVTHDELEEDTSKDWTEENAKAAERINKAAEVLRATEEEAPEPQETEDLSVATPQEGDHSLETDDLSNVHVNRDDAQDTQLSPEISEEISPEISKESSAEAADESESGIHLTDVAKGAAVAVAAVAVAESSKAERPKEEAKTGAPIWAYTQQADDYSDVVFAAEGEDDDLQQINGIDAEMESALKQAGIRQYEQIASLKAREVDFLRDKFNFSSTLNEQVWIEQAKILSTGALTAYAKSLSPSSMSADTAVVASTVGEQTTAEPVVEDPIAETKEENIESTQEPSLAGLAAAGLAAAGATKTDDPETNTETDADTETNTEAKVEAETEVAEAAPEVIREDVISEEVAPVEAISEEDSSQAAITSDEEEQAPSEEPETTSEAEPRENKRLFGEKERAERDEEWRNRYQNDRKIKSPEQSTSSSQEASDEDGDDDKTSEATDVEPIALSETETNDTEVPEEQAQGFTRPVDSDDLSQIKFISTSLEKKLNLLGIYKLSQIANWDNEKITEVSEQLELRRDKIIEEDWCGLAQQALDNQQADQASETASGGLFSASALVARLAELDKIKDLTEHEKTVLSNNNITELSQIANWSGADIKWATDLLDQSTTERAESWVATAASLINAGETNIPGGEASGAADDLKRIRGIDDEAAEGLKAMGVTTYGQIAEWQQEDMDRVNDLLGTSGRVERQYWVVQAKVLKDGGHTDFSKLYDES